MQNTATMSPAERNTLDLLNFTAAALNRPAIQPTDDSDLAEAAAGDFCTGCGRESIICSRDPCPGVIADRGESHMPPHPDGKNAARAEWAHRAVLTFEGATGADREDALCDLLSDLMHWCNVYGQDFDRELRRAREHYAAETTAN